MTGGWRSVLARAWAEERLGTLAVAVLVVMAALAVTAPLLAGSPTALNALHRLEPPSLRHPFGTDDFGRDVLARTLYGGRVSLGLGLTVTVATSVAGAALGLVSGFYPRIDGPLMRLMDGMMAFPPLVLAIALVAALGPGLVSELIALWVVFTPRIARVVRGSTLQLRSSEMVEASRVSGSGPATILLGHVLPNAMAPLVVQASFVYAEVILADAALSFLGLGVSPPVPTWGNMVADARDYLTVAPWFAVFPGLAIVVSVVALNLAGDSLRAVLLPHSGAPRRRLGRGRQLKVSRSSRPDRAMRVAE